MLFFRAVLVILCLAVAGCDLGSRDQADERKESHYLMGRKRLQERDYRGAIAAFEKALDANPRSASAHFELGVLYEQQENDYASALYHYQRTLAIRPDFPANEIIQQRIEQCKRELAKTVALLPSTEALQRQVDSLRAENQDLKQKLLAWQNYYAGRGMTASNGVPVQTQAAAAHTARTETASAAIPQTNPSARPAASAGAGSRTHVVASGETLSLIARRYGVRLAALQAANPAVDARRLRPGQTLIIPAGSQ